MGPTDVCGFTHSPHTAHIGHQDLRPPLPPRHLPPHPHTCICVAQTSHEPRLCLWPNPQPAHDAYRPSRPSPSPPPLPPSGAPPHLHVHHMDITYALLTLLA